jgi:hypothetical protein
MAQCITCGSELHPDRATKYDYCMAPECQRKNLKGLTMVAVGVNKFADQRRGSFGTSVPTAGPPAAGTTPAAIPPRPQPARPQPGQSQPARPQSQRRRPAPTGPAVTRAPRNPWTKSQERLALLYNEQGQRPEEIARKLGLSTYNVTQIILGSRNRGKL